MKSSFLACLILGAAVSLTVPSLLIAQEEKTTELSGHMEDMNAAFRRLSRQIKDPAKNADSQERAALLKAATEKSAKLAPALAANMPANKREEFIASYQAAMKEMLVVIGKLESALKSNDNPAAEQLIETIKKMRNEGHKQYKKPE